MVVANIANDLASTQTNFVYVSHRTLTILQWMFGLYPLVNNMNQMQTYITIGLILFSSYSYIGHSRSENG